MQHQRPVASARQRGLTLLREGDGSTVMKVACARDPDRWTTVGDEGAKALCRECPRRWHCAQEACTTAGAEGVWAGILIPESGRARRFALKQLQSLAELNGFPVRKTG